MVAQGAAGHAALGQVVIHLVQQRQRPELEAGAQLGAFAHLQQVAGQTEAGHVCHGVHARQGCELLANLVEGAHGVRGQLLVLGLELALLLGRGEDADAERFGQVKDIARLGGVVLLDGIERHYAGYRQAEDGLGGVDAVAASQGDPRLVTHLAAAVDHLLGHFRGQGVDGPAEDGDGDDGLATHGIDVADGVGGGDAAEGEGVIDDGHEEVGGGDDALTVADVHHGGVILAAVAHHQGRIVEPRDLALENGVEHLGGDFTAAASAMAVLGQTNGRHTYPSWFKLVQAGATLLENGAAITVRIDRRKRVTLAGIAGGPLNGPSSRTGRRGQGPHSSATKGHGTGHYATKRVRDPNRN
ncbi:hypothetical protein D3C85_405070 [compost metagenome]